MAPVSPRVRGVGTRQARAKRILDVAAELLSGWGYRRITIDEVPARAEIGKGTIYLHWPSREALFCAVLAREYALAIDELVATLRDEPGVALLHRMTPHLFIAVMRRPLMRAVVLAESEMLGRLAKDAGSTLQAPLAVACHEYLRLLVDCALVRADLPLEELFFVTRACGRGFLLAQRETDLAPERAADLLSTVVQRTCETEHGVHAPLLGPLTRQVIDVFSKLVLVPVFHTQRLLRCVALVSAAITAESF